MAGIRIIEKGVSCLDEVIGIRGCPEEANYEPLSGMYLSDLAGINIVNASQAADSTTVTGYELIKKSVRLAQRQVVSDFLGQLAKAPTSLRFNSILDDSSINTSGSYEFSEKRNSLLGIKVEKFTTDSLSRLRVFGFRFVSDAAVADKVITVTTDRFEEETVTVQVVKGINSIDISVDADVNWVRISFDLSDISIGRREAWWNYGAGCLKHCEPSANKCAYVSCELSEDGGVVWEETAEYFGFNLSVQCACSKEALACYYKSELEMALLYKAGMMFLSEVQHTDRVNHYTENSPERIRSLLIEWGGGEDLVTGIRHSGMYWKSLQSAVSQAKMSIHEVSGVCVSCTGNRITSELPR